jgi:hypothetical protein
VNRSPSREHSKVEFGVEELKAKLASVAVVDDGGLDVMVVSGGGPGAGAFSIVQA